MSKKSKPYTYTMPEEFLNDTSVPPRWRLLALMNGFFLNGNTFYASNEKIEELLNIKQWAISKGIKELEEMGKISCERTRRGRVCKLAGKVVVGSANTLPDQCEDTISDSATALPNSDSNSDSKKDFSKEKSSLNRNGNTMEGGYNYEPLNTPEVTPAKESPQTRRVAKLCAELIKKHCGEKPIVGVKEMTAVKRALSHLSEKDVLLMVEDACANGTAISKGLSLNAILSNIEINKYKLYA